MNSYLIHKSSWHAPHAHKREYVTVLHLHKSSPSRTYGPAYWYPAGRGSTVNAAKGERAMLVHVRGTPTAPTACGLQVCRNFTWTLIERIICLVTTISSRTYVDAGHCGIIPNSTASSCNLGPRSGQSQSQRRATRP